DYHQTNQKTNTGKTLKPWPILVDHYNHTKSTQVVCRVKDKGGSLEVCSDGISRFHSIAL
ncbi:hypothetical protein AB7459_22530, partial [Providencia rettgeri]